MDCPECNGNLILKKSKYGKFYGCTNYPKCQATHGAHPNGKPLGIPGDNDTKLSRVELHNALDKKFCENRKEIYKWLKKSLNKSSNKAHIALLNESECNNLLSKLGKTE